MSTPCIDVRGLRLPLGELFASIPSPSANTVALIALVGAVTWLAVTRPGREPDAVETTGSPPGPEGMTNDRSLYVEGQ